MGLYAAVPQPLPSFFSETDGKRDEDLVTHFCSLLPSLSRAGLVHVAEFAQEFGCHTCHVFRDSTLFSCRLRLVLCDPLDHFVSRVLAPSGILLLLLWELCADNAVLTSRRLDTVLHTRVVNENCRLRQLLHWLHKCRYGRPFQLGTVLSLSRPAVGASRPDRAYCYVVRKVLVEAPL